MDQKLKTQVLLLEKTKKKNLYNEQVKQVYDLGTFLF